jgi:hypothetical protein
MKIPLAPIIGDFGAAGQGLSMDGLQFAMNLLETFVQVELRMAPKRSGGAWPMFSHRIDLRCARKITS